VPADGRALHVYKLGRDDWLVSEVGRDTEGCGPDLTHAVAELFAGVPAPGRCVQNLASSGGR
jgi:hypothetical protein